jgi:dihydrofolate reductase
VGKLLYSVTMSLDGFITGPAGDMSWLSAYLDDPQPPIVQELIDSTGAMLVGNRTFGGDDPYAGTESEGEAFGGGWEGHQFVVTHNPERLAPRGTVFVGDMETGIRLASDAAGEKYVNVLGASIARQCIELGQLDEILTFIAPVLLGNGTRLFDSPKGQSVPLHRIRLEHSPNATIIHYRVIK